MGELLARGIPVDYLDLTEVNLAGDPLKTLAELPVYSVIWVDPSKTPFIALGGRKTESVEIYDVILQRKDPPVDDFYRKTAALFAKAPARILQINNPAETPESSEHELPLDFPKYSIPTRVCHNVTELKAALAEYPGESVLKPIDQCSGFGVTFVKSDASESELAAYGDRWKWPVIAQPYRDEITKSGDLRILVLNKKIMGSVLRVPKQGSRLANLHQGASSLAFTPTPRQLEAVRVVSEALYPRGLYLLGLDFIGDELSEINITSPSAMVQINEVMNQKTEAMMIDEIEALRLSR